MNSNNIKKRIRRSLQVDYEINQIERDEARNIINNAVLWFGVLAFALLALLYWMIEKGGTWI